MKRIVMFASQITWIEHILTKSQLTLYLGGNIHCLFHCVMLAYRISLWFCRFVVKMRFLFHKQWTFNCTSFTTKFTFFSYLMTSHSKPFSQIVGFCASFLEKSKKKDSKVIVIMIIQLKMYVSWQSSFLFDVFGNQNLVSLHVVPVPHPHHPRSSM